MYIAKAYIFVPFTSLRSNVMTHDISLIMNEWPNEPGKIIARLVETAKGETHIQVRLDLGILQMHADGRPDGERPYGFESLLDYLEERAAMAHDQANPDDSGPDSFDGEFGSPFAPPPSGGRGAGPGSSPRGFGEFGIGRGDRREGFTPDDKSNKPNKPNKLNKLNKPNQPERSDSQEESDKGLDKSGESFGGETAGPNTPPTSPRKLTPPSSGTPRFPGATNRKDQTDSSADLPRDRMRAGSGLPPPNGDDGSHEPANPDDERLFTLSGEECNALREEASQYVQRSIACLAAEEYSRALRDAVRNLRVMSMCSHLARNEADRHILEPYRGQLLVLRTKSLAAMALESDEPTAAVLAIDEGLDTIKKWFAERGVPKAFEDSPEVETLREMRAAFAPAKEPVSQRVELQERLQQALVKENYELAAILRDELRQLKD